MKKSFSTLGCADYTLEEVLVLCRNYRYSGLEIRGLSGVMDNRKIPEFLPENIEKTADMIKKSGIVPVVLGTSCKFHDRVLHKDNLEEGVASAAIASKIGCKYIRVFGNNAKPDLDTAAKAVADGIGVLCEKTEKVGVGVLLEVHGDFNTIENLIPVTEQLKDINNFGLIWDVYHTEKTGVCDWESFWEEFRPLIKHVHLKDGRNFVNKTESANTLCLPGEGEMPLVPIMQLLMADGFDGFVSLEWERKWHPELPPIEQALEAYSRVWAMAE